MRQPNSLISATSPYLLQHAYNPVWWHSWEDAVWQNALNENKLVIVSIGYSACHWCHVMEHESFENETVAAYMNAHFISIKVDREERPDIDQVYMDAVQIITGQGGWPLNAICLPNGKPIYAGTYFKQTQWLQVLNYLQNQFENNFLELEKSGDEICKHIQNMDEMNVENKPPITREDITKSVQKFLQTQDFINGGRLGSPKFPMPINYQMLFVYNFFYKDENVQKLLAITLQNLATRGLYDQVGGGFSRYSVDENWSIPHFEKMLYDNAQLISLFAHAHKQNPTVLYQKIITESIQFVWKEWTISQENGVGFLSALDADSEGQEGKFYVWKWEELETIFGDKWEDFQTYFSVSKTGNFEGENHLQITGKCTENLDNLKVFQHYQSTLSSIRNKRIKPALDDKTITSWHALMTTALWDSFFALQDKSYFDKANLACLFLLKNLTASEGNLYRTFKNGVAKIGGFLDDYALTIDCYLKAYTATANEDWLWEAKRLADYTILHFYNSDSKLFYYTADSDTPLIARKTDSQDNVIPSSNSVMALNLWKLAHYFEEDKYLEIAEQQTQIMQPKFLHHAGFYANWMLAQNLFLEKNWELVITGKNALKSAWELQKEFLPNCIILIKTKNSSLPILAEKEVLEETVFYVCSGKVCYAPLNSVEAVLEIMRV